MGAASAADIFGVSFGAAEFRVRPGGVSAGRAGASSAAGARSVGTEPSAAAASPALLVPDGSVAEVATELLVDAGVVPGSAVELDRFEVFRLRFAEFEADVAGLAASARCISNPSKNESRGCDGASCRSLSTSARADLKSSVLRAVSICAIRSVTSRGYSGACATGGVAGCGASAFDPNSLKPRITTRRAAAPPPNIMARRLVSTSFEGDSKLERAVRAIAAASESESVVLAERAVAKSRGGSRGGNLSGGGVLAEPRFRPWRRCLTVRPGGDWPCEPLAAPVPVDGPTRVDGRGKPLAADDLTAPLTAADGLGEPAAPFRRGCPDSEGGAARETGSARAGLRAVLTATWSRGEMRATRRGAVESSDSSSSTSSISSCGSGGGSPLNTTC